MTAKARCKAITHGRLALAGTAAPGVNTLLLPIFSIFVTFYT